MNEQPAPQADKQQPVETLPPAASPNQTSADLPNRDDLQSVYPEVGGHAATESTRESTSEFSFGGKDEEQYKTANVAFSEAVTLGLGVASSVSYVLIVYLVKSMWGTAIISALLAAVSILFAFKSYRASGKMSPLSVIGLSASTITLVYIGNMLVAQAVLRSVY